MLVTPHWNFCALKLKLLRHVQQVSCLKFVKFVTTKNRNELEDHMWSQLLDFADKHAKIAFSLPKFVCDDRHHLLIKSLWDTLNYASKTMAECVRVVKVGV